MSEEAATNEEHRVALEKSALEILELARSAAGSFDANVFLSSELTERLRFAQRAGLQYGTRRYLYKVAGFVAQGSLTFDDYWAKYDRQDVAKRIVDMPAQTTWRNPPEVYEVDEKGNPVESETEFTRGFRDLVDRLSLWQVLERVDRLSGIGRYGVLLFGFRAGSDQELLQPVGRMRGPEDLLFLTARHEGSSQVTKWNEDPTSEFFGLPETYKIQLSNGVGSFPKSAVEVHRSRILHVAEDLLEDEVHGVPRLKPVMNLLDSLEKITAATGEAYWQLADRILLGTIDPNAKVSGEDRKKLGEAMEELMHDLRRQLVGQGLDMRWLESTPPDPMSAAKLYFMLIGAAKGIPFRLLFGNETGERSSSEDMKHWLGQIAERQERFASPMILRRFIDRLIELRILPKPRLGYVDVWPTLWETPELEVAERNAAIASAAKDLTPIGGDPVKLVEVDEDGLLHLVPRAPGEKSPFEDLEPPEPMGTPPGAEGPEDGGETPPADEGGDDE